MTPSELSAIEEDIDLGVEGLTPYWAEVVRRLVAEAKHVQYAEERLQAMHDEWERYGIIRNLEMIGHRTRAAILRQTIDDALERGRLPQETEAILRAALAEDDTIKAQMQQERKRGKK